MTRVLDEVLTANEAYALGFGDKGALALPPARRFAILTCMDARLDPAKFAGLKWLAARRYAQRSIVQRGV
jgi:carbonic anhydrase